MKAASAAKGRAAGRASEKLLVCLFLITMADFLFYDHAAGWTIGAFCLLVLALAVEYHPLLWRSRSGLVFIALCAGLGFALIEATDPLALFLFCLLLLALLGGIGAPDSGAIILQRMFAAFGQLLGWSAYKDFDIIRRRGRVRRYGLLPGCFRGWVLPVASSLVFLWLFVEANPVIEKWLLNMEGSSFEAPALQRVLFWCLVGLVSWGLLRVSVVSRPPRKVKTTGLAETGLADFLFSREAVTRSLVICNLLFLGQNLLDTSYLWAGVALPEGMNYAEYAHRGAYPLVVTALLAAIFVLITMRKSSDLAGDRRIRRLVYFWLLQNMVLVISSIWRTDLYISEYSLTYLRLAALIWMGLVLLGLIFILLKIIFSRSLYWLVSVNLTVTLATLYISCFIDLGRFIAEYNVAHAVVERGNVKKLDHDYLYRIGPSALPALERMEQKFSVNGFNAPPGIQRTIRDLRRQLYKKIGNWRSWTFRDYRLHRRLKPWKEVQHPHLWLPSDAVTSKTGAW